MRRLVRFVDVYLLDFDHYGTPQWVPRDEAAPFATRAAAHSAKRRARRYEGDDDIVVVKVRPRAEQPKETKP